MKYLSLLVLTAMLFPALAFASDDRLSARSRNAVNADRSCIGLSARDSGLCIRDKQKNLVTQRREFLRSLSSETRSWHLRYDRMGVSEEYQTLLNTFLEEQQQRRKAYDIEYRSALRALEAERKTLIEDNANVTDRPRASRVNLTISTQKSNCFQGTREEQRSCIRDALYANPALSRGQ